MTSAAAQIPLALSLLRKWGRALLLLAFVMVGSITHMSVMSASASGTAVERLVGQTHSEHCTPASCHEGAHHPSECCGGGPCACIFETPSAEAVIVTGILEHFVRERTLTGQLREGIDRPPKAMRTRTVSPQKQDS
jgi:hypothetical protein